MRALLVLCMCLAACGGTTTSTDGGADATTDGTSNDGTTSDGFSCTSNGLTLCNNACVNTQNDPHNCGSCNAPCSGGATMCLNGACVPPTCNPACGSGQTCCQIFGPGPSGPPQCEDGGTCPVGCPLCK